MAIDISITKSEKSSNQPLTVNDIAFGKDFTDHMFIADFDGDKWGDFRITPIQELSVHPSNSAWHYVSRSLKE